ncbi:MAG: hypothetical protein HN742_20865 [Lentisphaerae bacterium]|nr:hypothetical protein [Lentisphaerota bacterium]MBT4814979.1 hypothetical protein [Lentisphaerota bacterium]MBT5610715.1 hypothetical protein [Lentisphaerota bacterium]MBT7054284.1 hypothetical protein [Lentisphaerota bacterium]MBT7844345.1 hypothetical protein [Lentisphaerota bacterium]
MGTLFANAKDSPTYYTPERVAAARHNAETYPWAKAVRKRIFTTGDSIRYYIGPEYTAADAYAAQTDDFIWLLQPDTRIARIVFPRDTVAFCPKHGADVKKISVWCPWRIDPISHPYQIQCMLGKEWYPSNAYHEGDLDSGEFADNGQDGCLHGGKRYFFLREYAHLVYGSVVVPTLRSLSEAYQLTGDPNYARKGCILLARLATQYPNYGWDKADGDLENRFDRTYLGPWDNHHPHYKWKQGGMITDLIWETFCLEATVYAYDGLWAYMDQDPDMLSFLRSKGMPVETASDLRQYIETYIFRAAAKGLLAGWIKGNEGFHQAAAMALALVLDDYSDNHPNSRDLVDYAFHGIGNSVDIMINGVLPDGGGHESPNYALIKLDFIRVSRLMEAIRERRPDAFPEERYPDLFADPKAKALFDYYIDIISNDYAYPSVGDCGGLRTMKPYPRVSRSALKHENLFAVEKYRDPRHALSCLDPDGELFTGELWEPYPEKLVRELAAGPDAAIVRRSRVFDDYGVAILESGGPDHRRTAILNYASLIGHRQHDHLNLEFLARRLYLLQDMGYPKTWEYREQWDSNALAHNTVTIDETPAAYHRTGALGRLFASTGPLHMITASHNVYRDVKLGREDARPVDLYERTVLLIDVDDERFYTVDLFLVNGGEQHDQSWHAFATPVVPPDLGWDAQDGGTLAGPNVQPFATWKDRWGRERNDVPSYVTEVRSATLTSPACWTWKTALLDDDQVRLHVVPVDGPLRVLAGRGGSPVRDKIDYVFLRNVVPDGGASRFLSVIDTPRGEPTIKSLEVTQTAPLQLRVHHVLGHDTITLNLPTTTSATMAHRPVGARLERVQGKDTTADITVGTLPGSTPSGYVTRAISAVDHDACRIALPTGTQQQDIWLAGRTLRLFGDARSALYQICQVEREGGCLWLTLDRTPLLARARITRLAGKTLSLDSTLIFCDRLPGALLQAGAGSVRIVSATKGGQLTLEEDVETLTGVGVGDEVRIMQYGTGDTVEIARIVSNAQQR